MKILRVVSIIMVSAIIALFWQNCSKKELSNLKSKTADSQTSPNSQQQQKDVCSGKADGTRFSVDSGETDTVNVACAVSGNSVQTYTIENVFECQNEVAVQTEDTTETFESEDDSDCVQQSVTCGDVAEGEQVTVVDGTIDQKVNCSRGVYSAGNFSQANPPPTEYTDTYERLVEKACVTGLLTTVKVLGQGNLLQSGGVCASATDCIPSNSTDPLCSTGDPMNCPSIRYIGKFGKAGDSPSGG